MESEKVPNKRSPTDHPHDNIAVLWHSLSERNRKGWRRYVLNFTPSWFSVNMGTGVVSILLHNLPYNGRWLYWISVLIFALNVFLFCVFTVVSFLRYTLFKGLWACLIRHPVQSLFLGGIVRQYLECVTDILKGTFPMGLTTIVNMMIYVCVPVWGSWACILAWALWWIASALAIATNMILPFLIMYQHESKISTMTAVWLLPIVATIVAAASGSVVASALENEQYALWTVLTSYILWGTGVPLAMFTMVMYFQRLTLYALPPRETIVSVFLPLGPLGQGAFGIMQLGLDSQKLFSQTHTLPNVASAGDMFYINGFFVGLIMWGFGLVWLFFAMASITRTKFPFNLGAWGFIFPLGVYASATVTISKELPSAFFKVLGTVFSLTVVLLWLAVSVWTVVKSCSGDLFYAPCLADWERLEVEKSFKNREEGKEIVRTDAASQTS